MTTDGAPFRFPVEAPGEVPVRGENDWTTENLLDRTWPVGSVYISTTVTTAAEVAEKLGGGTWAAIGAGRVLIGIDSTQAEYDTLKETGGAETSTPSAHSGTAVAQHTGLTHTGTAVADHASHTHDEGASVEVNSVVSGTDSVWDAASASSGPSATLTHSVTQPASHGTLTHSVTQPSNHSAMSVVQPYLVVSMWERTA